MRLYEIILPVLDNQGQPTREAHAAFRSRLRSLSGGFTYSNVSGEWTDDQGQVFTDDSIAYRFAEPESRQASTAIPHIVSLAARLFPDQLAIFWAQVGDATIWTRAAAK